MRLRRIYLIEGRYFGSGKVGEWTPMSITPGLHWSLYFSTSTHGHEALLHRRKAKATVARATKLHTDMQFRIVPVLVPDGQATAQ